MIDPAAHAIVLFDGTCLFCEGSVKFIALRDPKAYFKFGASQTTSAQELLEAHHVSTTARRSIVLIEDGRVYLRSTAALRIASRLSAPWHVVGWLLVIPRPLRDAVYDVVAAIRHRIAGESNACEIPPAELRGRLI